MSSPNTLEWLPAVGFAFLWILALGGSVFTVVFFRHEDDRKGSWGAKSICVIGLFSSIMGIFMLPLDVFNRSGGTVPMGIFWMIFAMFLALQVLFMIPWALVWYDSERTGFGSRLWGALKTEFWILLVFGGLVGICFHFFGEAVIPMKSLSSELRPRSFPISEDSCGETCSGGTGIASELIVKVCVDVLGWKTRHERERVFFLFLFLFFFCLFFFCFLFFSLLPTFPYASYRFQMIMFFVAKGGCTIFPWCSRRIFKHTKKKKKKKKNQPIR
jgi:hypothetical protein